jgi:hypothetical protein
LREVAQLHEAVAERRADLLARLPRALTLGEIGRLGEDAVEVVRDHGARARAVGATIEAELETIEAGALRSLGRDAPTSEIGIGLRRLCGEHEHRAELTPGEIVELVLVLHQEARAADHLDRAP